MTANDVPMSSEIVLDEALPGVSAERVQVRRIRMAPNVTPGAHVHNGPVFGSIVEGSVVFQVEGRQQMVLGPGDVFFEPANDRISHFDSLDGGATFLAYFPLEPDQQPEIEIVGD